MKKAIAILCAVCFLSLPCFATETQFYTFKGGKAFAGPVKTIGIGIHSKGHLTLIPRLEKIYSPAESIIWSVMKSGNTVYAGVGETGKILYFVDGGESGTLAELGKFAVKALVSDNEGAVLAGGPDGKVYKFTDLKTQNVLYESGEKYIWSLLPQEDGSLIVGTGPEGKIFHVKKDGTGELLFDGEEKHILCLARSGDNLFAGTSGKGIIYKIDIKTKKGGVFAELPGDEIVSMYIKDGSVYAIPKKGKSAAPKKTMPVKKTGPPSPPAKPSIYQIPVEGGDPKVVFECPAGNLLSIAPLADGRIAAGTDAKGVIYIITDKENFILSSIENTGKILSLFPLKNGFLAGTEKKGFICRALCNGEMDGEYISKVNSIPEIEKWGVAEVDEVKKSGSEIAYAVRTGKSPNTDEKWSDWKEMKAGDLAGFTAACTYFQLKVTMKDSDGKDLPAVKKIRLSYLPKNIAPVITFFKDSASGGKSAPPRPKPGVPAMVGPAPKPPFIMLQWKVMDKNRDALKYSISYRAENEDVWMTAAEKLTAVKYSLSTVFIPDGKYKIKLSVSDEDVNMPGKGFVVEKELDEYTVVDRTPPVIMNVKTDQAEDGVKVTCSAADILSNIRHGFYRLNNGDWLPVYPDDLLFDEKTEDFTFVAKEAEANDILFLRFIDEESNSGLYRAVLKK